MSVVFNESFRLRKRFFYFSALVLCACLIIGILFFGYIGNTRAQVATWYPASCLGGWQNTDRAAGIPNVSSGNDQMYSDDNSASVFDSIAQIFCGEFRGGNAGGRAS